ncbi:MAG: hypothetical protein ABEH81_01350 [Halopenitus sp.]
MNVDDVIGKIAESNAMAEADVKEIYDQKLEECEEAGLKGDEAKQRALKRLWSTFKRQNQSNAVKVEGYFIGAGDRYDAVGYSREEAVDSYQENPQRAIKEGEVAVACPPEEASNLTGSGVVEVGQKNGWSIISHENNENILQYNFADRNPDGSVDGTDDANTKVEDGWRVYPLDTRESFNSGDENPNYGMPQDKHQWTRRGLGLFTGGPADDVRIGNITFRDKISASEPPLYEPVQFKARVDEDEDTGELYINSTSDTEVEPNPDLGENVDKTIDELIEEHFAGTEYYQEDLQSLYEYMAEQNGRRTVVVKSDVISMDLEPNSNNTMRLVLGEMEFDGREMVEHEVTVWVPAWQKEYIDFAVDSRVYVIGRANISAAYDPETGGTSDTEKEVNINAQGLYADPTVKIPREDDTESLEEDDFDFEPEDGEGDGGPDFDNGDW